MPRSRLAVFMRSTRVRAVEVPIHPADYRQHRATPQLHLARRLVVRSREDPRRRELRFFTSQAMPW